MDKSNLSESDLCDKFIRPAMEKAGWNGLDQIFREYPLRAGRVVVRGNKAYRDKSTVLRADYALFYKANIPLAVVEAKDNKHAVGAGMGQALNYAQLLDVPFSFSSNGDGFVFRDATLATGVLEQNLSLEEFPSPQELWRRYCTWKGWSDEESRVAGFDYAPHKTPRYYQLNAVNRAVEAIAAGRAVVVVDDADRENEGDLIFAAGKATPELVGFMIRHTSGVVCVPMPGEQLDRLRVHIYIFFGRPPCASHVVGYS